MVLDCYKIFYYKKFAKPFFTFTLALNYKHQ